MLGGVRAGGSDGSQVGDRGGFDGLGLLLQLRSTVNANPAMNCPVMAGSDEAMIEPKKRITSAISAPRRQGGSQLVPEVDETVEDGVVLLAGIDRPELIGNRDEAPRLSNTSATPSSVLRPSASTTSALAPA